MCYSSWPTPPADDAQLKGVLRDSETLRQCIRDALSELKERKEHFSGQTASIDKQLEAIRLKKERLGLVFTDGTIAKNVYEGRLQGFRKQEKELLKIKNNIRSLLQNFTIKVYVFKDRIEVQGHIPTEIISLSSETKRPDRELLIPSARGRG